MASIIYSSEDSFSNQKTFKGIISTSGTIQAIPIILSVLAAIIPATIVP
jgi:hypothetical protein